MCLHRVRVPSERTPRLRSVPSARDTRSRVVTDRSAADVPIRHRSARRVLHKKDSAASVPIIRQRPKIVVSVLIAVSAASEVVRVRDLPSQRSAIKETSVAVTVPAVMPIVQVVVPKVPSLVVVRKVVAQAAVGIARVAMAKPSESAPSVNSTG